MPKLKNDRSFEGKPRGGPRQTGFKKGKNLVASLCSSASSLHGASLTHLLPSSITSDTSALHVLANRSPGHAVYVAEFHLFLTLLVLQGGWFSRFWGLWQNNQELKIVIIGLNNAGKTTILYKLYVERRHSRISLFEPLLTFNMSPRLLDEVVETTPTVGSNVEEIKYKNLRFFCWDIGGQNALRQSWSYYFADTDVRSNSLPKPPLALKSIRY